MGDSIALFLAHREGSPVAGALNLVGPDCLYGRYWGCTEDIPFLHFELCYYQAIDFAIAHGLARVEAGRAGRHKLVRGYKPVATWSAHHVPHPDFRRAVAQFLAQERAAVSSDREWLSSRTPFKNVD
jgi:predicted N-acyltransferase